MRPQSRIDQKPPVNVSIARPGPAWASQEPRNAQMPLIEESRAAPAEQVRLRQRASKARVARARSSPAPRSSAASVVDAAPRVVAAIAAFRAMAAECSSKPFGVRRGVASGDSLTRAGRSGDRAPAAPEPTNNQPARGT